MFQIEPLTPTIGAVVRGVDLRDGVDADLKASLEKALYEWKVLFFRDQPLTMEQHIAFAGAFGELEIHPFAGGNEENPEVMQLHHGADARPVGSYRENIWHSDVSWREVPSMASVLRARVVPAVGGDTLFTDMGAVLAALPPTMQQFLEALTAKHDFYGSFGEHMPPEMLAEMRASYPIVEHPVVRTHSKTGEKILYVNQSFTTAICGFEREDSVELLRFLTSRAAQPDFQCRFHWEPDSIAMWDNAATQHYAVQDYFPQPRHMDRVTIIGERPQ